VILFRKSAVKAIDLVERLSIVAGRIQPRLSLKQKSQRLKAAEKSADRRRGKKVRRVRVDRSFFRRR